MIENRKHEKITNERGLVLFLNKTISMASKWTNIQYQAHERVRTWYRTPDFLNCCIYYIAKTSNWQYIFV